MFGFPASTEFGKRIPKQKFYENIDITSALKRVFVEQIRLIYWRNKLATATLNLPQGANRRIVPAGAGNAGVRCLQGVI